MGKYESGILKVEKVLFRSKTYSNLEASNIEGILEDMKETILNGVSNFQTKGSGWFFQRVLKLQINSDDYQTLKGSSYMKLPNKIAAKQAIINIQNKDGKCFMWSILRYFHIDGVHDPQRLTDLKQYENDLNFKGITFAVKLTDISKFENRGYFMAARGYEFYLRVLHEKIKFVSPSGHKMFCLLYRY